MNLGENIKKIRKDNHLSQEELADKLNVSRQSVSKWENGDAYPEMDKMVQICKLFNVNIDDLINNDIKEVNNNKEAKSSINKFIESFLDYITKTVNMFCSLKFKDKIKCIFEELVIIFILGIGFIILERLLSGTIGSALHVLPHYIYNPLITIFSSLYTLCALIIGVILVLHIFKTRYLDYYKVIDTNKEIDTKEIEKVITNSKEEKIIIRDPNHSGFRFISGLLKILLIFFKIMCAFLLGFISIGLIFIVICVVMSFIFVHTGLTFVGAIIGLISGAVACILAIIFLYEFIFNRKIHFGKILLFFIISLVGFGVGIGLFTTGLANFDIITDINKYEYAEQEVTMEYKDGMYADGNVKYVEGDNKDLKINIKYVPEHELVVDNNNGYIHIRTYEDDVNKLKKRVIKDINNKKIVEYGSYEVVITTSKENIEKMKKTRNNYEALIETQQETIDELSEEVRELKEELTKKEISED